MTRATEDQVKKKSFAKIGPRLKKGTTYTGHSEFFTLRLLNTW